MVNKTHNTFINQGKALYLIECKLGSNEIKF